MVTWGCYWFAAEASIGLLAACLPTFGVYFKGMKLPSSVRSLLRSCFLKTPPKAAESSEELGIEWCAKWFMFEQDNGREIPCGIMGVAWHWYCCGGCRLNAVFERRSSTTIPFLQLCNIGRIFQALHRISVKIYPTPSYYRTELNRTYKLNYNSTTTISYYYVDHQFILMHVSLDLESLFWRI